MSVICQDQPPKRCMLRGATHWKFLRSCKIKNPAIAPCVTVPLNLLETGGTRRVAFDFQSRPVGHNRDSDSVSYLLRFKDIVSNHVHRQGKAFNPEDCFYPDFEMFSKEPVRLRLCALREKNS